MDTFYVSFTKSRLPGFNAFCPSDHDSLGKSPGSSWSLTQGTLGGFFVTKTSKTNFEGADHVRRSKSLASSSA